MIDGLIEYNLKLQAVAINSLKKLLNISYASDVDAIPLFDAINARLDEAIRLQKRVVYLERLKLDGQTKQ